MKYSLSVKVEVSNISVSKQGWYMFDFKYLVNGKLKEHGNLDGSYSSQTAERFRQVLKRGYAAHLVLERYA
ncbi:hypothetical protein [uncultured Reyranella sp.]|uniref:hypothetical protein n=1 Tax=uncultured Reyranella sp. TaxID=735512 RepID=UPI0025D34853|nr:hypothetical protein [uncultured Reyranella sp.]